ncbi:hypothetical protein [Phycicoccus sp.]|uniref:hypothetical protein n=1 Tax=Phycicoccus sp. TaxID=1902410 RepID=UPI002C146868|nr:hypothetical protein [Phycicoccus sp.]HMM94209.1 hypothetical protein [Phycicoccus sp.]
MSFFERAKAAASDLAAKADVAMSNAGISVPGVGADRALRDLGVVAWLDATGRPVSDADRERVMATLRELESSGRLGSLSLTPVQPYGTPPPPPGAAAAGAGVPAAPPPPPTGGSAPPPPPPPPGGVAPAGDAPAPPPPGAAPDPRPHLADPGEEPPASAPPPPPPPPSWA